MAEFYLNQIRQMQIKPKPFRACWFLGWRCVCVIWRISIHVRDRMGWGREMVGFPVALIHEEAWKHHNSPNRMFLLGLFEGRVLLRCFPCVYSHIRKAWSKVYHEMLIQIEINWKPRRSSNRKGNDKLCRGVFVFASVWWLCKGLFRQPGKQKGRVK